MSVSVEQFIGVTKEGTGNYFTLSTTEGCYEDAVDGDLILVAVASRYEDTETGIDDWTYLSSYSGGGGYGADGYRSGTARTDLFCRIADGGAWQEDGLTVYTVGNNVSLLTTARLRSESGNYEFGGVFTANDTLSNFLTATGPIDCDVATGDLLIGYVAAQREGSASYLATTADFTISGCTVVSQPSQDAAQRYYAQTTLGNHGCHAMMYASVTDGSATSGTTAQAQMRLTSTINSYLAGAASLLLVHDPGAVGAASFTGWGVPL